MKIGLQIPKFTWPNVPQSLASTLRDIVTTAEDAGFASLWVMDHYFQLEPFLGQADEPMLEGYTTLSHIAALTERVKLGTLVTGVIYRQPAFLIKQVTTLDVLSGGRAYFGVGAAWYDREAHGLGFPFPSTAERFEWLEETLQIARHMWSGNTEPYQGQHFTLEEPINSPQPISQPYPPIMIGGMGEKKTLRMVAQYADACNLFLMAGLDVVAQKLDILRQHCEALGRDYDTIEKTALGTVHLAAGQQSADDIIAQCRQMAEIGIEHVIFNMPNVHEIAPLEQFGEVIIPAVAEL
ncbi:MAG: LLM class F420-dependent oxidoreductase [Chloroflexi bacterium]|nr:MAG: LLM class F420-dependent oxidoreductase [Chloroflexota bacterium]